MERGRFEPRRADLHSARRPRVQQSPTMGALRALGNDAAGVLVQTKLAIGAPGDRYEQEADRVAEQVVGGGAASFAGTAGGDAGNTVRRSCAACSGGGAPCPKCEEEEKVRRMPIAGPITPIVQREAEGEEEEERVQMKADGELVQREAEGEEEEERVQMKSSGAAPVMTSRSEGMINAVRGGGSPMAPDVRAYMEPRFGHDFGAVRVHTDARAAESARSIGALAYTIGRDVVFGAGRYDPGSREGKRLIAHELTHVVQQGASSPQSRANTASHAPDVSRSMGSGVVQRSEEDLDRLHASDRLEIPDAPAAPARPARVSTPNPTAAAPPAPLAPPGAASFAPLTGAPLADRRAHGLSTDSGPMVGEIETVMFPTGGANPPCTPIPASFETTVATALSTQLRADIPVIPPADAPDPMTIATASANAAMPIINSYYSPHAPSVSAASFMARVSRKATNFADPIRNNDADLAEFLEWYAGARAPLRTLTADKCGMNTAWWVSFAGWLGGAGASWNAAPHQIRERSALYDTYRTSVTAGGRIQFGRGFSLASIPHTVTHEAMHLFQHPTLTTQINRLQNLRSSTDIITEGFAEYLARGVRDRVVNALQANVPPTLTAAQATTARAAAAYPNYFDRAVQIRDILYRHGQDGEEAIRRAFFLGEGWRFGLLESATAGSPIETDRAVPTAVNVHFGTNGTTLLDPAVLAPLAAYLNTRSIATVEVVGRTDSTGNPAANLTLGQQRADAVKAQLMLDGVPAAKITTSSRGSADQIAGGLAANRRATVTVTDSRNQAPGLPGPGRP